MAVSVNILAASEDIVELLTVLALVVLAIGGSALKKYQQRKAAERYADKGEDQAKQQPPREPASRQSQRQAAEKILKSMGVELAPVASDESAKRQSQKKKTQPPPQRRAQPDGRTLEQQRRETSTQSKPKPPSERAVTRRRRIKLTSDSARQAIIYHEIFSPPKSLRTGPEMWDR